MSLPDLLILRHGETEWNLTGRLQGRFDAPLTVKGIAQAQAQRDILARCDLSGYTAISSPQGRALETARIALAGLAFDITTDPALAEIGLGDWAGEDRAALITKSGAKDGFDLYELAPGGEGFDALRHRCEVFLSGLASPAVIVTHGITSRMLRLIRTGRPTSDLRDIGGGQGVVYHMRGSEQHCLDLGA